VKPSILVTIIGIIVLASVGAAIFLLSPSLLSPSTRDIVQDPQVPVAPAAEVENGAERINPQEPGPGELLATIETEFGNIVLKLSPQTAPGHVENFIKLAREGFYDGTTFHRVIPGFMIQGGDPNTKDEDRSNDGQGGPGYELKAEFSNTQHKRGILSMARSPAGPDTAGSQFFIVVTDSLFLDGQYSVFGEVVEGMDVVDRIVNVATDGNDNPIDRVVITSIRISP
jgi:peptidyl-prolyl cis-trans isomerase B (cyclophilin B)